ncbi:insulinase family protein [Nocardioides sp. LS1]|uniref:insulinase family protein n=1 Tax=Nocardioides sp. LS1 TaxID=1027620 RepID=UPI000F619C22|nr:insulinase family protein [Nocardioides sp. LS1]GCD92324.1 hypothetical protein NLS1_43300 [Nocardioides sp. LS1]
MESLSGSTVFRTDVDGVPCFWVRSGRPTLTARLLFRTGAADESLHESGWTHLLEHLALHDRDGGGLQVNGSVSVLHTAFDAVGSPEAVAAFLTGVASWVSGPDLAELDRERRVLAVEAQQGTSAARRAFTWRYGACGPGIIGLSELGLGRATAERLSERARRIFTRGNAALVLDGPPPADLDLALPEGSLVPPCAAESLISRPFVYRDTGIVISGVVPRSGRAGVLADLLRRSLIRRLRHEDGSAYSPWAWYEPVDADHGVVLAGADISTQGLNDAADRVYDELQNFGRDGWVDERLVDIRLEREQALLDPFGWIGLAHAAARSHLDQRPIRTLEEELAEIRSATPGDIHADLVQLRNSLLLAVPHDATWSRPLPTLIPPRSEVGLNSGARSINWPSDRSRLLVTDEAITMGTQDHRRSIKVDDVAAVLTYPEGLRILLDREAWSMNLEPSVWQGGDDVVARIDAMFPPDLYLPQPPHEQPPATRISAWRRWRWVALDKALVPLGLTVSALLMLSLPVFMWASFTRRLTVPVVWGGWFIAAVGFGIGRESLREYRDRRDRKRELRAQDVLVSR